jgi:diguanylate cyclase (GGDEF)-like protein
LLDESRMSDAVRFSTRSSGAVAPGGRLVVTYVDVGLKAVNDTHGHSAGDALLRRAITLIRARLRPYDLVIRLGGDEFVCAMSAMTLVEVRERFGQFAAAIATPPGAAAIRTGYTELRTANSVGELIARADREMTANRAAGGGDPRRRSHDARPTAHGPDAWPLRSHRRHAHHCHRGRAAPGRVAPW